jgi:hypothetical protein
LSHSLLPTLRHFAFYLDFLQLGYLFDILPTNALRDNCFGQSICEGLY